MHAITCGANFLPVFQFCVAEQEVCRLTKSRDSPGESKKVSMRSATASLCQSFLLAFQRVFRDEGEEDHLDDQRDHRGQECRLSDR